MAFESRTREQLLKLAYPYSPVAVIWAREVKSDSSPVLTQIPQWQRLGARLRAAQAGAAAAFIVFVLIGFGLLFVGNETHGVVTVSMSVAMLSFFVLVGLELFGTSLATRVNMLQPAAEFGDCVLALQQVRGSELARSWRDLALAEGRTLRCFDFEIITALHLEDSYRRSNSDEAQERAGAYQALQDAKD